ncbi:hypothetical protein GCM10023176_51630 [Micromonospora coerulea]|uniref:Squalene cyclase C-terminal domain-containing protein n=1 Tax=Micromonospora coerulea TaxID=47856 RepID=A0ABP8SZG4_9ACTN
MINLEVDVASDLDQEAAAARRLVAAMMLAPHGQSSASVYETGRLVSLAPWLHRHAERIDHLLLTQGAAGGWGGPEGYALVPTLSAVEALLAALLRGDLGARDDTEVRASAVRALCQGLVRLRDLLGDPSLVLPDLPAIDLIVPALVESLNGHLARLDGGPPQPGGWPYAGPLPLPAGMGRGRLERVRQMLGSGGPVPHKIWHALEVGGPAARRAVGGMSSGGGVVGASPAATAAWTGTPDDAAAQALTYLEETVRQYGGPVPPASPIAVFERAWVLSTLSRAGVPLSVPAEMLSSLVNALGPAGTPTGPGLPPDADTTSVTLSALARLGRPVTPASLWAYDTGEHFCTWHGEDGASVTTNAHVLDALGWQTTHQPPAEPRLASVVERLTAWLCAGQGPDGAWSDRWHASPYYATCCVVLALAEYGRGAGRGEALDRAAAWLIKEQRTDGSWGRWGGTVEETAYALQALLASTQPADTRVLSNLDGGYRYMSVMEGCDGAPALWHDKDLYRPTLIVDAAVTAARYMVRRRLKLRAPGRLPDGLISAA